MDSNFKIKGKMSSINSNSEFCSFSGSLKFIFAFVLNRLAGFARRL